MRTLIGGALVAAIALAGCSGGAAAKGASTPAPTPVRPIHEALSECMMSNVLGGIEGDGGHSASMSTKGSDAMTVTQIGCVLGSLKTPDSVLSQISGTTAMMGVQSGSWGDYQAKWTYHPDNGLHVIVWDGQAAK